MWTADKIRSGTKQLDRRRRSRAGFTKRMKSSKQRKCLLVGNIDDRCRLSLAIQQCNVV